MEARRPGAVSMLTPRGRGRPPISRPRNRPYDGRPGGLRTGSPPSPPPRSIRPTVRRLPWSPRLSGPGPRSGRSIVPPRRGGPAGCPAPGAEPLLFGGFRCRRRRVGSYKPEEDSRRTPDGPPHESYIFPEMLDSCRIFGINAVFSKSWQNKAKVGRVSGLTWMPPVRCTRSRRFNSILREKRV